MKHTRALLLLVPILLACGGTRFASTWREPSVREAKIPDGKIAAFVISPHPETRRGAENAMTRSLKANGANAVAGHTFLPGDAVKDRELAKRKLAAEGFTAVVLMRPVTADPEVERSSDYHWFQGNNYSNFMGYWGNSWPMAYDTAYLGNVVQVETMVYSLKSEKLVWAARSKTRDPESVGSFMKQLVGVAVADMRKSGMLAK